MEDQLAAEAGCLSWQAVRDEAEANRQTQLERELGCRPAQLTMILRTAEGALAGNVQR